MNPSSINFEPLKDIDRIELGGKEVDLSQSKTKLFEALSVVDRVVVVLLVIVAIVLVVFSGIVGMVFIVLIPAYVITKRLASQQASVWQKFALANGWSMLADEVVKAMVPPSLQKAGNSHKNSLAISGKLGQIPFSIFWFQFSVGSGKNSRSYPLTILDLQVNANLPQMVLKAPQAQTLGNVSELKAKLQLEGDFNKYFKVYTRQDDEVDELTVLTPDFMQFLIQKNPSINIETSGSNFYLMADGDQRSYQKLPVLLNFAVQTYNQLLDNLPMAKLALNQTSQPVNPPTASPVPPQA